MMHLAITVASIMVTKGKNNNYTFAALDRKGRTVWESSSVKMVDGDATKVIFLNDVEIRMESIDD